MKLLPGIIFLVLCFSGCYYDKANLVYPVSTACDTTNTTYSGTVSNILSTNCYSCHSGSASAGGGIKLDSYTNLKIYITNGQLLSSINQTGAVPSMPLNSGKLSSCDINKITAWINGGSVNN